MNAHDKAARLSLNEGQAYVVIRTWRGLGCLPAHVFDTVEGAEFVATYYDGVLVERGAA